MLLGGLGVLMGAAALSVVGFSVAGGVVSPRAGIANGGFESGLGGWSATGSVGRSHAAHEGRWSARVGATSTSAGDASIAETFPAPANGGTLIVWYRPLCHGSVTQEWVSIALTDQTTGVTARLAKVCTDSGQWVPMNANLAPYAGHTVRLKLASHAEARSGTYSYGLFDAVALVPPRFSLSVAPVSAVAPGASTKIKVSTRLIKGSAPTIALSATHLPQGVTAYWDPPKVTGGQSSVLTLAAAASAPTTATRVTVTGSTPSESHNAALTLSVSSLAVHVVGNHLVNAYGHPIRLLGVNRPGMDNLPPTGSCLTTQDFTDVSAIAAWHINAVRIPLNEDCWLGINGLGSDAAREYRAGVERFVSTLHRHGLYAILDLHVSAPGATRATSSQAMPDSDHAPAFWSSVAATFVSDPAVVFDLFNEPHLTDVLPNGSDYWGCWLSGCTLNTSGSSWHAAGMQQLVNAVRATGAVQPLMLEGLNYADDLESCYPPAPCAGWLDHTPTDSAKQLVASVHMYDYAYCHTVACWTDQYGPVARKYPIVTGELGENDCGHEFIDQYMPWADANGVSYLAWAWTPQTSCTPGQGDFGLISSFSGAPSTVGVGLHAHLAALAG